MTSGDLLDILHEFFIVDFSEDEVVGIAQRENALIVNIKSEGEFLITVNKLEKNLIFPIGH